MKLVFATFLLISLLLLNSAFLQTDAIDGPNCKTHTLHYTTHDDAFCSPKCKDRCAKAGVQDRCLKYCAICCVECKCVPSGTYGNKHECPCYRDKKNKKGQSKCP